VDSTLPHRELNGSGSFRGFSPHLVATIYAIKPGTLTKILMVVLMALASIGLIATLWILSTASPDHPVYWNYLYYIKWVFLPPWLIINIGGAYYFLKTKK